MPGTNAAATNDPSTVNNANRMAQMQAIAYQQQMMMMQQQMQHMQMGYGGGGGNFVNAGGGPSPMPPSSKQIMGANYMRQVPGVQGDKMTSFSFLGSEPKKQQNTSFDFVKDAMNTEKK